MSCAIPASRRHTNDIVCNPTPATTEHKPSPAPLLHAAGLLGVDPGECVYVGDADVDVLAARAAGMGSLAVTWGAATGEHLTAFAPDAVLDDVAALRAVLLPDPCS